MRAVGWMRDMRAEAATDLVRAFVALELEVTVRAALAQGSGIRFQAWNGEGGVETRAANLSEASRLNGSRHPYFRHWRGAQRRPAVYPW